MLQAVVAANIHLPTSCTYKPTHQHGMHFSHLLTGVFGFLMPAAPPSSEQRSPCRDLSLSLSMAENTSPDLPIFGLAPASSASLSQLQLVQHQQQQQLCDQQRPSSTAAADRNAAPEAAAVAGGRGGNGTEDDTTGELYSSLIHSNFIGVPRQSGDDRMQMDPEPGETVGQTAGHESRKHAELLQGAISRVPVMQAGSAASQYK